MSFRALLMAGFISSLSISALPAFAQNARQETVVVTANFLDADTGASIPAIRLIQRADQVIFEFTMTNGTRDKKDRERELKASYDGLVDLVSKTPGVSLMAGFAESQARIETANFEELETYDYRTERSNVQLVLLFDVEADDTFKDIRKRADAFKDKIKYEGRAEGWYGNEQFLSLSNADQYRRELLGLIAKDVELMKTTFGDDLDITLDGLENPVAKQPADAMSIMLYIPYNMMLTVEADED